MTATYPTSRRSFTSDEAWPSAPLLADTARALADWQNYTYNADLPVSPCDAKIWAESTFHWQTATTDAYAPRQTVTSQSTFTFGFFTLTPPRAPSSGVRLYFKCVLSGSTATGTLKVKNDSTQVVTELPVTYAALGSALVGWLTLDVPAKAMDQLVVRLQHTAGTSVGIRSMSGHWLPTALWDDSAVYAALSQAHVAADRPGHSYLVRRLMKAANRFQEQRAPQMVLNSFLGKWACGNTAGYDASNTDLGSYKVLVGEGVDQLEVNIYAKADAAGSRTVLVKIDGSTVHTFTVTGTSYAWQSATITITPPTSATVKEIQLVWGAEASSWVMVPVVSIWEARAAQTLPGSETVPTAFAPNDNGAMLGRSAVTAAQWSALVANMVWIWSKRGLRSLVCDCRYTAGAMVADTPGNLHALDSADAEMHALRRFRMSDGVAGVPRLITQCQPWQSIDTGEPYVWTDDAAEKASGPTTGTRMTLPGPPTGTYSHGHNGWSDYYASVGQYSPWYAYPLVGTSSPWLSLGPTIDLATWAHEGEGPLSADQYGMRVCGMVIEQMPLNTMAGERV